MRCRTGRVALAGFGCALAATLAIGGCGERSVAVFSEQYPIGAATVLHLDQRAGDLSIVGEADRETVDLAVELRSERSTERKDDEARDALRMGLVAIGDGEARILAGLHRAPTGYAVNVVVIVPDYVTMIVQDGGGTTMAEGFASLTIDDAGGDLSVAHIGGDIAITDEGGDIDVRDIFGHVTIDDAGGAIAVANIVGDLTVDDSDGAISVAKIIGDATIDDEGGDIDVRGVGGTLRITDGAGDIDVSDAAEVVIVHDDSGDVRID